MILKKIILYHSNPLKFGGVDTFDYNFCKRMQKKYEIIFLYKEGEASTIDRLSKLEITVEKYKENKIYWCDICLLSSAWGGYPENVFAKSGRYIQMIHADYKESKLIDFEYKKWHKTTEHVGVSDLVCESFKKLYPKEKITRIYNILDEKKEDTSILKLISATRLSKEKGYKRMLKLAEQLKAKNIKFIWLIFTDLNLYNERPFKMDEIIYMNPTHDIFNYIAEADYGVQLSDTEGYSYFINECLQYGTPVISTNFPSVYESIEDGKNGYILDMELSNLDLDKIVNNIPKNFKYMEKGKPSDWTKFFNKKISNRQNEKIYKIVAQEDYDDKKPQYILDANIKEKYLSVKAKQVYYVLNKNRAEEIKKSGLAKVEEVDIGDF